MEKGPEPRSVRILKELPTSIWIEYPDKGLKVQLSRTFFYRRLQMGLFTIVNQKGLKEIQ